MIRSQRGATLIVVLILLVALIIIGTLAVRQSIVSLSVATNSQAQQLLLQNSDAAFFNVEKEENLIQSLTSSGMFGYISGAENKDRELVFCYRGADSDTFFDIARASIIFWQSGQAAPTRNSLGTDGYCSVQNSTTNFFTSGRRAVVTQVAVKFSTISENDPFFGDQRGSDTNAVKLERSRPVKVFAVSIMPAMTTANLADVDTCLNARMNEVTIPSGTTVATTAPARLSVTECLEALNVPFTSHVNEYVLSQDFI